jgi:hypothetical protein
MNWFRTGALHVAWGIVVLGCGAELEKDSFVEGIVL